MDTEIVFTDEIINENTADDTKRAKEGRIILISSLIISALFNICFRGAENVASLSSVVFFNAMSIGLFFILKLLGILVNKRAFVLAVPIFLLSVCNAYFEYSYYNIFNCIGFYVLFSVMTLWAADLNPKADIQSFLSLMLNNCFSGTAFAAKPARDMDTSRIGKALLGVVCSAPVFCVVAGLLLSADKAFSDTFAKLFDLDIGQMIWAVILFVIVLVYFCGYLFCALTKHKTVAWNAVNVDNTIAVSFLTPVNMLFVFFCVSQLKYLAAGMGLPEFTTYSQYAREGFFQLLFVTFINFAIILVFTELLKDVGGKALKASLTLLCVFTFILILSSYYRMYLYINTYGFTPLRIEVLTFLTAEVVLVFMTIAAIVRGKTDIISRFVFFGALTLLVLNVIARPEVSTRLNLDMYSQSYEAMESYKHSDIPILIELYESSESSSFRSDAAKRICQLYLGYDYSTDTGLKTGLELKSAVHTPWQSVSIQESKNDDLAEQFINKYFGE